MATGSDKNVNINVNATDKTRRGLTSAQRNLKRTSKEADNMAGRFRSLARATVILEGPLGGTAGRVSALATLMGSVNASAVTAGAGIASLTAVIYQSLQAFAEFEQQTFAINQLLEQTGNAAGLTGEQIEMMARDIGEATLESTEGVRDAATTLLTFRSIAGDAFGRTLNVAADLAATTNVDLRGAIIQLGKALEDPATGMSALRRSGVSFTNTQKEMIVAMRETGQVAEAQAEILQILENQLGGAARAKGEGLAGAVDLVVERWNRMLENFAKGGAGQAATDVANAIATLIDAVSDMWAPDDEARLEQIERQLLRQKFVIDDLRDSWWNVGDIAGKVAERQRDALEKEKQAILARFAIEKAARVSAEIDSMFAQEQIAAEEVAEKKLEVQKKRTADAQKERTKALGDATKYVEALGKENEAFQASLMLKSQQEDLALEMRLEKLQSFRDQDLISNEQQWMAEQAAYELHNSKMTEIHERELRRQQENAIRMKQMEVYATRRALDDISSLMSTESRALFNIGKMAAVASAIINTHEAVTKTMASVPFPWNKPLAAAQLIAGMAQVAAIKNTKMSASRQTGGVVLGGRTYLVGERGPELFTAPSSGSIINNNDTQNIGGNTNVINVTVVNESDQMFIERNTANIWNTIMDRMNEEGMRFA